VKVRLAEGEPHDFKAAPGGYHDRLSLPLNTPGAPDLYQVVHVLEAPPNNEQYRLRGIHEPHERVVRGHQISLATSRAARSEARLHPEEPQGTFRSTTKELQSEREKVAKCSYDVQEPRTAL
jgi:hypothetical protein